MRVLHSLAPLMLAITSPRTNLNILTIRNFLALWFQSETGLLSIRILDPSNRLHQVFAELVLRPESHASRSPSVHYEPNPIHARARVPIDLLSLHPKNSMLL